MRHLFMGGFGHHAMMMGFGAFLLQRLIHRIVMMLVIGGLVAAVIFLWLRLQAARRGYY